MPRRIAGGEVCLEIFVAITIFGAGPLRRSVSFARSFVKSMEARFVSWRKLEGGRLECLLHFVVFVSASADTNL